MYRYPSLVVSLLLLLCVNAVQAGKLYQCKQADGGTAFQDRPCEDETVKVEEMGTGSSVMSTEHMIGVLSRMTGRSEADLNDPDLRQAAEAMVAIDAAKAYAFTKVYDVPVEFCGPEVSLALTRYKETAHEVISLGQYYYSTGIYVQIKGETIAHSGRELTEALDGMLVDERKKYQYANRIELPRRCDEAVKALRSLTTAYGS